MATERERQLAQLQPGDHLCLIYESREEQLSAALPFLVDGIRSGRRCVYIVDDLTAQDVREALALEGIDVAAAEADGTLEIETKAGTYHRDGHFEPSSMLAFLEEEIEGASERGRDPLRVTGEMTWALGPEPGNDRLLEYEASLDDFVRERRAIVICQYNRNRFSPEIIRDILRIHPIAVIGDTVCPNPFYEPPSSVLGRADPEQEVERMISTLQGHRSREMQTERREGEMALILEQTPDIISRHDGEGRVLYVNEAVTRLTGRAPGEFVGRTLEEAGVASETAAPLRAAIEDTLRSGEPTTLEQPVDGPEGRRWLHTRVVPEADQEGRTEAVLVIARDVTREVEQRDALRKSEQQYRTLFEQSGDAVFVTAWDGTVIQANPACLRLFGYDERKFFSLPASRHYADAADCERMLALVRSEGAVRDLPVRFLRSNGEVRHCLLSATPWTVDGSSGFHGIIRDNTELWRRTRDLQERVKELRCLYDVSALLVRSAQPLGTTLDQVVRRVPAGLQFEELAEARLQVDGGTWATPGFRATPWMEKAVVSDGEATVSLEVAYREEPPVGGERCFFHEETYLVRALAERIAESVSRRGAEDALVRRERRFRTLIEEGSDLISILDPDGTVRYESPSVGKVLGWEAGEIMGRHLRDFIHPDDMDGLQHEMDGVLRNPSQPRLYPHRLRHRDGTWRSVETVIRNLVDDPDVAGVVTNTRDVTERVELEHRLLQSQKLEAVGRLAGGVAHDFNNLLTAIRGYATLLLEELADGHPSAPDAGEILKAVDRAGNLTKQLLAFSRKQVMRPEIVSPDEAVGEMQKMLSRLIGEDITLETRTRAAPSAVVVDRVQLEQVLMNLVVNARDAMPSGGTILVETERRALEEGGPVPPGAYVVLTVRDTGSGIPRHLQERVFEPFFTTKETGTGLGLATVFGIVTQSGGHVRFDSEEGVGTVFEVFLPAVRSSDPADPEPSRTPCAPTAGSETILLAEDDPAVRSVTRRLLERSGYVVLEAGAGDEAVRTAREQDGAIHLLITDLVMPGGGGGPLAQEVRKVRPDIRTIYMSGYSSPRDTPDVAWAPPEPFLQKPFAPEGLLEMVRRVLDEPG